MRCVALTFQFASDTQMWRLTASYMFNIKLNNYFSCLQVLSVSVILHILQLQRGDPSPWWTIDISPYHFSCENIWAKPTGDMGLSPASICIFFNFISTVGNQCFCFLMHTFLKYTFTPDVLVNGICICVVSALAGQLGGGCLQSCKRELQAKCGWFQSL